MPTTEEGAYDRLGCLRPYEVPTTVQGFYECRALHLHVQPDVVSTAVLGISCRTPYGNAGYLLSYAVSTTMRGISCLRLGILHSFRIVFRAQRTTELKMAWFVYCVVTVDISHRLESIAYSFMYRTRVLLPRLSAAIIRYYTVLCKSIEYFYMELVSCSYVKIFHTFAQQCTGGCMSRNLATV